MQASPDADEGRECSTILSIPWIDFDGGAWFYFQVDERTVRLWTAGQTDKWFVLKVIAYSVTEPDNTINLET